MQPGHRPGLGVRPLEFVHDRRRAGSRPPTSVPGTRRCQKPAAMRYFLGSEPPGPFRGPTSAAQSSITTSGVPSEAAGWAATPSEAPGLRRSLSLRVHRPRSAERRSTDQRSASRRKRTTHGTSPKQRNLSTRTRSTHVIVAGHAPQTISRCSLPPRSAQAPPKRTSSSAAKAAPPWARLSAR